MRRLWYLSNAWATRMSHQVYLFVLLSLAGGGCRYSLGLQGSGKKKYTQLLGFPARPEFNCGEKNKMEYENLSTKWLFLLISEIVRPSNPFWYGITHTYAHLQRFFRVFSRFAPQIKKGKRGGLCWKEPLNPLDTQTRQNKKSPNAPSSPAAHTAITITTAPPCPISLCHTLHHTLHHRQPRRHHFRGHRSHLLRPTRLAESSTPATANNENTLRVKQ